MLGISRPLKERLQVLQPLEAEVGRGRDRQHRQRRLDLARQQVDAVGVALDVERLDRLRRAVARAGRGGEQEASPQNPNRMVPCPPTV